MSSDSSVDAPRWGMTIQPAWPAVFGFAKSVTYFAILPASNAARTASSSQRISLAKFKITADYNFFYKIYKLKYIFRCIDEIISTYEASDGVSSKQRALAYKEICTINGRTKGLINKLRYIIVSFMLKLKILKWKKYNLYSYCL